MTVAMRVVIEGFGITQVIEHGSVHDLRVSPRRVLVVSLSATVGERIEADESIDASRKEFVGTAGREIAALTVQQPLAPAFRIFEGQIDGTRRKNAIRVREPDPFAAAEWNRAVDHGPFVRG